MKEASRYFLEAVRDLGIDFVALPLETTKALNIAITAPDRIYQLIEEESIMIQYDKGELYARWRRLYTATKVAPIIRPVLVIPTQYKRLKDIPPYHNMLSRGFEIVTRDALNNYYGDGDAVHIGDDISKGDVVSQHLGIIECKVGRGKFKKEA